MDKILNQGEQTNCGTYAIMWILQHYWVQFDFESVSKIREPLIMKLQKRFIDLWLVKHFIPLPNTRLVDMYLKRGEYLITGTKKWNFNNPPNVTFDWNSEHYFIICENLVDKYKCVNSWGDKWGDKWYFYINKSDFSKMFTPRRLALK